MAAYRRFHGPLPERPPLTQRSLVVHSGRPRQGSRRSTLWGATVVTTTSPSEEDGRMSTRDDELAGLRGDDAPPSEDISEPPGHAGGFRDALSGDRPEGEPDGRGD